MSLDDPTAAALQAAASRGSPVALFLILLLIVSQPWS